MTTRHNSLRSTFVIVVTITVLMCGWLPNVWRPLPVYAAVDTFTVSNSIDDCMQNAAETWFTTLTFMVVQSDTAVGTRIQGGILFESVTIDQGSTISSANLSVYVYSTTYDDPNFKVYANDVDDAATFGSGTILLARTRTTANTSWVEDSVGTGWHNITVTGVVQEVVNRGGWSTGNNMSFLLIANADADKVLRCNTYDEGTYIPKLYVEIAPPAEPTSSNVGNIGSNLAENSTFHVYWSNNLSHARFGSNISGSWVWDGWTDPWDGNPDNGWYNVTKELPAKIVGVDWVQECNNTVGTGSTGNQTFTTTKRDYTETETLECVSSDANTSEPSFFVKVEDDAAFLGTDEWITEAFTNDREYCKWVRITDILSEEPGNFIRGYEIEVYDYLNSSWHSPASVYAYTGSNPGNFKDGNTATYWDDQGTASSISITLQLDQVRMVSQIKIYVADHNTCNWTGADVYLGKSMEWSYNGTSPWLNATDYQTNYISAEGNSRISANFTFSNSSFSTVLEVLLIANISCSYSINVVFWNGSAWVTATDSLPSTSGAWQVKNVTLNRLFWSAYHQHRLILRFNSTTATVANPSKIDYAYLWIRGFRNQTRTLEYLFDTLVVRIVNSTFPFAKQYNEKDETYTTKTDQDLLSGALLYKLTDNTTYLDYAYEYADWLDTQPVCRLFQRYDSSSGWDDPITPTRGAENLIQLSVLAGINSSYKTLLQTACNNFTAVFLKTPEYRLAYSYINGTTYSNETYATYCSKTIAAFAHAGSVLGNSTLHDIAKNIALNYTLGSKNIPYHFIYMNGTKACSYSKEDETYGNYLLALEMLYYHTTDSTIKDRIKDVAEASQYFYNTTKRYFEYRVDPDTGEVTWPNAVHGFGLIDEALITAYLIWENTTWLDYAIQDFETLAIEEGILQNDLIKHQIPQPVDSNDYWNSAAKRAALIFYNLNYSATYQNQTFLATYNKLYGATSYAHYNVANLGWVSSINTTDLSVWSSAQYYDILLSTVFRNFINVTDTTLNTFSELYAAFGNPFTGETFSDPLLSSVGGSVLNSTHVEIHALCTDFDGLDYALLYWNVTESWTLNSTHTFTGNPTEEWSNYTKPYPSGLNTIYFYIVANDTEGNWGNTTVQSFSLAQTYQQNSTVNLTFDLSIQETIYKLFQQFSETNLLFALSSLWEIYKLFIENPVVNLVFSLSSLNNAYKLFLQPHTINLVFSIASITQRLAEFTINPSLVLQFAIGSTQQIFRLFNQNPKVNVVFNLATSFQNYMIYLQGHSINVVFNLASTLVKTTAGVFNVNPTIILKFAIVSVQTGFQVFTRNPALILNFALASTATFYAGLHYVWSSLNLVFQIGSVTVNVVVPTVDVTTFGTVSFVIAIIALAIGVTALTAKKRR